MKAQRLARKPIVFVGDTQDAIRGFPQDVSRVIGFGLLQAQEGQRHKNAKPFGKSSTEIVVDHDGDTYRAVYTVKLPKRVFVLHCFKKKSKRGIATPLSDVRLIESRYEQAEKIHKALTDKDL